MRHLCQLLMKDSRNARGSKAESLVIYSGTSEMQCNVATLLLWQVIVN